VWVAKGIIEKHGGSIRFRSNTAGRYRGTYFSIFLPYEVPGCNETNPVSAQIGRELLQNNQSAA
jgi:nitrogen-specific signal transduction histidine kinase